MQIQRIPFPPVGSNMYVVTQGRDAIVLDPWPDETTMQRLQGYHVLLVLTHEHVDHISGLGRMQRALAPPREKCLTRAAESGILLERSKDSRWLDRGNPAEDASITMFLFCFRGFGRGNFFGRVSFTRR